MTTGPWRFRAQKLRVSMRFRSRRFWIFVAPCVAVSMGWNQMIIPAIAHGCHSHSSVIWWNQKLSQKNTISGYLRYPMFFSLFFPCFFFCLSPKRRTYFRSFAERSSHCGEKKHCNANGQTYQRWFSLYLCEIIRMLNVPLNPFFCWLISNFIMISYMNSIEYSHEIYH